jgi:hypothetical protein
LTPEIEPACAELLLALESSAESAGRGLWQQALYRPHRAEDTAELLRYRSTYQIVEGVISRVAPRRSAVYLNFGSDWKRDFTAKLPKSTLARTTIGAKDIKKLVKLPVRIRGWIERRNGPLITIWRLEQVELLALTPSGRTIRRHPPRLLSLLGNAP